MKQVTKLNHTLFISLLLGLIFITNMAPLQAQTILNATFLNADSSRFPDVRATVRVTADNQAVAGLVGSNFIINESNDTESVAVTEGTHRLNLVFVVDMTLNNRDEQALFRDFINQFANNVYQPDDNVTFILMNGGNTEYTINSVADLQTVIGQLQERNFNDYSKVADYMNALERGASLLQPMADAGEYAEMVLIASYLPNDPVNYTNSIPLNVAHLHTTRDFYERRFQGVATDEFFAAKSMPSVSVDNFFSNMIRNRLVYNLTYRSRQAAQGTRQVLVTVNTPHGTVQGTLNYQFDVFAPEVSIVSPQGNEVIERNVIKTDTLTADGQKGYTFDTPSQEIVARVTFPDGHIRRIESATLMLDDVAKASVAVVPDPLTGEFSLTWDLQSYDTDQTHNLAVQIKDYYSLTARSNSVGQTINVIIPEGGVIDNACYVDGQLVGTLECWLKEHANEILFALGVTAALAIAAFVFSGVMWRSNMQLKQSLASAGKNLSSVFTSSYDTLTNMGSRVYKGATNIFGAGDDDPYDPYNTDMSSYDPHTMKRGGSNIAGFSNIVMTQAELEDDGYGTQVEDEDEFTPINHSHARNELAKLVVVGGWQDGSVSITTDQYIFDIGKERAACDFVIPKPNISRLHCQIKYDNTQKQFTITDLGSSNGTSVNDNPLMPHTPVNLTDGDIIQLGKLQKNSIFLRFDPNPYYLGTDAPDDRRRFTKGYEMNNIPASTQIEDDKDNVENEKVQINTDVPQPNYKPSEGTDIYEIVQQADTQNTIRAVVHGNDGIPVSTTTRNGAEMDADHQQEDESDDWK